MYVIYDRKSNLWPKIWNNSNFDVIKKVYISTKITKIINISTREYLKLENAYCNLGRMQIIIEVRFNNNNYQQILSNQQIFY